MKPYIGWIFVGTLALYPFTLCPSISAGATGIQAAFAWLVPIVTWPALGKVIRNQSIGLIGSGIAAHVYALCHGAGIPWWQILTLNLPLLAMFVAVAFLALANADMEKDSLPKGKKAVIQTAFGTHLLASVINVSVLFVFGDRMQKNGRLSRSQLIILARSFCAAGWWSPFFIATGVALTYAPGMTWHKTLIPGILMSMTAIAYSVAEICFFPKKEEFSGYPFKPDSLTIPVLLAAMVLIAHFLLPRTSILSVICILAPAGAVTFMKSRPRTDMLRHFIATKLLSVGSQFTLFLAAGVFSTGIKSVIHLYPDLFTLGSSAFTPQLFSVILGLVILVGIIGVHPVVSISILSPLLLPLNPDPSQLGFLFLSGWAISTGSSPLSGVGLVLVGRYRASAVEVLKSNWHYAVAMWLFASAVHFVFFAG